MFKCKKRSPVVCFQGRQAAPGAPSRRDERRQIDRGKGKRVNSTCSHGGLAINLTLLDTRVKACNV